MEKKFSGAPSMVSPAYMTSPTTSCGKKHVAGASMSTGGYGYPMSAGAAGYGGYPTSAGYAGYGYPTSAGVGPTTTCPTNVAPTTTMPAVVSPTKHFVQPNLYKHIVPHVHPTHKTTVNQHLFEHQHYFPYTKSVVNQCCSQQVLCGRPPCPCSGHHYY